jgi:serine/threonine protein kinase
MRKDNWGIDNFVKLKDLGKGAFGKVILAMEKQIQFICAIKIISKECIREDNMMEQLIR